MKKLGILVALSMTLAVTAGCDSTCGTFCEGYVMCSEEDLDEVGCKFDDDLDLVIEECEEECNQAYEKLSGSEAEEFDLCIDCVEEEIGAFDECRDGDLNDAIHDCDNECEEDGPEEFFEDFGEDFDPDIDC